MPGQVAALAVVQNSCLATGSLAADPTGPADAAVDGKNGKKAKARNRKSNLVRDCEKLIESDDITAWSDLPAPIKKAAWDLLVSPSGNRLLEKLLSECRTSVQIQVLEQLRGRVWEASTSREANYIIQFCIEVLPSAHLQFIIDEIAGSAVVAVQNRFAVRIVERLIEFCTESQTSSLVDELISSACELCCHHSGNYAIQHILEFGTDEQRHLLATRLANGDICKFARDKVGNHVVSCALAKCSPQDAQMLAKVLIPELESLLRHHNGSFVTRELKKVKKGIHDEQTDSTV